MGIKIKLGSNIYEATGDLIHVIKYKGKPLFTIKKRMSDEVTQIDLDVYNNASNIIGVIRNSNAQTDYNAKEKTEYDIHNKERSSEIVE